MHFRIGTKYFDLRKYKQNIYAPYYNDSCDLSSWVPEIYNKYGERMDIYYVRDVHSAHSPQNMGRYFLWDRYNFGLKTHFYSHWSMLETMGAPTRKFGYLGESKAIVPEDYQIFEKYKGLEKEFDAIFTYDEKLLNDLPNAKFAPICASCWYGNVKRGGAGRIADDLYLSKTKNVSIVSADKELCKLHKFRKALALKCKEEGLADTYGTFDGGNLIPISESLENYRFSIVIENDISKYFFTERIINCFAAQTIPIYLGATAIGDFFNTDGIITIRERDIDSIDVILKQCTEKEYMNRMEAVLDNYNRAKEYDSSSDYIYRHYLQDRNSWDM